MLTLCTGILIGVFFVGGITVQAAESYLKAYPSTNTMFLDGQQIKLKAYVINGNNYVRLRDIGEAMDFNVYWDGAVQIDSDAPYTGQPAAVASDLNTARQETIRLVNQVRRENGVPELTVHDALMDAAQERAETLYTYHRTQEDCEAVIAHGYPYGFGTNITAFTGVSTSNIAQQAVTNWINSPGHFQTMIDPDCDTIGVGIAQGQNMTVCYLFVGDPTAHNPYGA